MSEKENKIPKWLSNLQENSWELELLISGGAIFSLFHFSDVWLGWINTMKATSALPGTNIFLMAGILGIKILTIGFVLHLMLRSYWLAMVCINFIYPKGINKEKSELKKPFRRNFKTLSDLHDPIMRVDKLCGTVMFMSITYAFALIGLMFTLFCIVTFPILLYPTTDSVFSIIINESSMYLTILFIVYILDFILFGLLRKIPYLSYVIYPFFFFFDRLSFRFIYQQPLSLLHTNVNKFKLILSTLIFLIFSFIFTYLSIFRIMHWPNVFDSREYVWSMSEDQGISDSFYRDIPFEGKKFIRKVTIQSKLIKDNYVELCVIYDRQADFLIKEEADDQENAFFSEIIHIKLNGKPLTDIEWHPTWGENIDKIGLTAMIPIHELENKKHTLSIWNALKDRDEVILFWKDVEKNN